MKKLTEEEKQERMENAAEIAHDIYRSLGQKLVKENLGIADSLHVGVMLGCYLILSACEHSKFPKEEVLGQFIEALEDQVYAYEPTPLN